MPEIDLQGSPLQVNWSPSYYPWTNGYEGFEYRDDKWSIYGNYSGYGQSGPRADEAGFQLRLAALVEAVADVVAV